MCFRYTLRRTNLSVRKLNMKMIAILQAGSKEIK